MLRWHPSRVHCQYESYQRPDAMYNPSMILDVSIADPHPREMNSVDVQGDLTEHSVSDDGGTERCSLISGIVNSVLNAPHNYDLHKGFLACQLNDGDINRIITEKYAEQDNFDERDLAALEHAVRRLDCSNACVKWEIYSKCGNIFRISRSMFENQPNKWLMRNVKLCGMRQSREEKWREARSANSNFESRKEAMLCGLHRPVITWIPAAELLCRKKAYPPRPCIRSEESELVQGGGTICRKLIAINSENIEFVAQKSPAGRDALLTTSHPENHEETHILHGMKTMLRAAGSSSQQHPNSQHQNAPHHYSLQQQQSLQRQHWSTSSFSISKPSYCECGRIWTSYSLFSLEQAERSQNVLVNPFGVFSQRGKQKVFTERVPTSRPRLFSSLWCLCVCLCALRGVMGRFVFWKSTTITHLLNGWAVMTHSRRHFGQGNVPSVAPMHAFRREFAAIGCAIMVSLPQTAPDVPAAEIDPTAAELQQIGDSILSKLGSGEPVRVALIRVLNGDQPLLRVPADEWRATVHGPRIPQSEIQRDLTAPEVGYVACCWWKGNSLTCGGLLLLLLLLMMLLLLLLNGYIILKE